MMTKDKTINANEHTKVAIYSRVSTEEQAEQGYSIDAQLNILNEYCRLNRKLVYKEYVDRGISGKSIDGRTGLQELLKDAESGLFNEVVVWKINRISRKQLDLLKIVDELNKHRVTFRSYSENFETETPMGRFALQMMGSVAELERNTIIDNVRLGMNQRAREGKWNGGVILGYKSVKTGTVSGKREVTRLEIISEEAHIVRNIFNLYANGKGLKAITNQLNHEGYRTKRDNPFDVNSIKTILHNPIYIGNIRYNKRNNTRLNDNKVIDVKGKHEPIISMELWYKVQSLYKEKSHKPPRTFYGTFPLTGLLKCPVCGSSMVAHKARYTLKDGTKVIKRYYSCGNWRNKGSAVCHSNLVYADYAEQYIYNRIKELIFTPKVLNDIVSEINKKNKNETMDIAQELNYVDNELSKLKSKQKKYFHLFENDSLCQDDLLERLNSLKSTETKLKLKKAELESNIDTVDTHKIPYDYVEKVLNNLYYYLKNSNPVQEKELLHLFIDKITVTSDRKIEHIKLKFNESFLNQLLSQKEESSTKDSSVICKNNSNSYPLPMVRFTVPHPEFQ